MDAIGDYILFRNFLKVIIDSNKYSDYKITLCGNSDWKDLSLELDNKYFDNSYWINFNKFMRNPFYRLWQILKIRNLGFETVIQPTYSRLFEFDNLVKLSGAVHRIGSSGDTTNQPKDLKIKSDNFYTQLIESSNNVIFEFYRNREFFENLLNVDLGNTNLQIEYANRYDFKLTKNYALIFPSAKASFRRWSTENYAKIIDYLFEKYGFLSALSGNQNDIEISNSIIEKIRNENVISNFTGKSSLVELIELIKNSRFLISNDTSAVHIAGALNIPTICISNGNHIFRFNSYPSEISKCIHTIYPSEIEELLHDKDYLIKNYYNKKRLDINTITVDRVISEIENNFHSLLLREN
jgi:ADP-heptose:LPS heptosyltransferase